MALGKIMFVHSILESNILCSNFYQIVLLGIWAGQQIYKGGHSQ